MDWTRILKLKLQKYIGIYWQFILNSFSEATTFRTSFFVILVMDNIFYLTSYFSIYFLFDHLDFVGEWNKDQFLFFIGFVLVLDHLHMTFISENFWTFPNMLKSGELDFVLLKPVNPIFVIFFHKVRSATIVNLSLPWIIMIYHGMQLDFSTLQWLILPLALFSSLLLFALFEIVVSLAIFWTISGIGINFLRTQFQNISRWPDFIFSSFLQRLFTFGLPILTITNAPVKSIFLNDIGFQFAMLFGYSIISAITIHFVWKLGLKQYESASS